MSATYFGSGSIGEAIPGAVALAAAGSAAVDIAAPNLEASISAVASIDLSLTPPSIEASLTAIADLAAQLQLNLALGITPPDISAQVSIAADVVAQLSALQVTLNAHLSLILALQALFVEAGVHRVVFNGSAEDIGSDIASAISAAGITGANTDAILLLTQSPLTWDALAQLIKTVA